MLRVPTWDDDEQAAEPAAAEPPAAEKSKGPVKLGLAALLADADDDATDAPAPAPAPAPPPPGRPASAPSAGTRIQLLPSASRIVEKSEEEGERARVLGDAPVTEDGGGVRLSVMSLVEQVPETKQTALKASSRLQTSLKMKPSCERWAARAAAASAAASIEEEEEEVDVISAQTIRPQRTSPLSRRPQRRRKRKRRRKKRRKRMTMMP